MLVLIKNISKNVGEEKKGREGMKERKKDEKKKRKKKIKGFDKYYYFLSTFDFSCRVF